MRNWYCSSPWQPPEAAVSTAPRDDADIEVSDSARSHFYHREDIQHPKAGRHRDEKVAGQNALGMIVDNCHPGLKRGPAR